VADLALFFIHLSFLILTVVFLDALPSVRSSLSQLAAGTQDGWEDGDRMMRAL